MIAQVSKTSRQVNFEPSVEGREDERQGEHGYGRDGSGGKAEVHRIHLVIMRTCGRLNLR